MVHKDLEYRSLGNLSLNDYILQRKISILTYRYLPSYVEYSFASLATLCGIDMQEYLMDTDGIYPNMLLGIDTN